MNGVGERNFNKIYFIVCTLVFVLVALRAFFIPFSHDEASTFFFYIQSDTYLPYHAHLYTNNHVLNSALANLCYHIAGSHRFVLRIPNLLAFIVLCFGVFKFFRYLQKASSKIILVSFFILTFGFLDIFELCRGYGLSMALLVLGLAYLQDYFSEKKFKAFLCFSICWQLALCANLTLVMLSLLFLFFTVLFQYREKLVDRKTIFLQFINVLILAFWIKFSFYYKAHGKLDSGWGDDYWVVSFKSLILFIFGTDQLWIQIIVIALFLIVLVASLYKFFSSFSIGNTYKTQFFYLVILCALILCFYLQKKLLDVNYPEDRTGLFFYIFFALSVVFFFESLHKYVTPVFAAPFLAASLGYFVATFNLTSFTHFFYSVIPKEVYSYLEKEYMMDQHLFTIGGHMNREMNYTFVNYRGGSMLNLMDDPPAMCMNCDYNFALKVEEPYYRFFYDEVVQDEKWGRVLLKRKQKIERVAIPGLSAGSKSFSGDAEFYEFLRFSDSALISRNCMEADVQITFKKVPEPFRAFLTFQVNDTTNNTLYYKRIPLNWIADNLNGQTRRFKLTTGALPPKFKDAIVYIWNIDKKNMDVQLEEVKISSLNAPGINVSIPQSYYPYIAKFIKQPQL